MAGNFGFRAKPRLRLAGPEVLNRRSAEARLARARNRRGRTRMGIFNDDPSIPVWPTIRS